VNTQPCDRCGDAAAAALRRSVRLSVDGDEVDGQTLCPDCFADWIARYRREMAAEMSGADGTETTDGDIRIAEEDESVHSHQFGDGTDQQLREAVGGSGGEIRELGTGTNGEPDDNVEVDLDGEATVSNETDEDGTIRFD